MKFLKKIAEEEIDTEITKDEDWHDIMDSIRERDSEMRENEYKTYEKEEGNKKIINDFQDKINNLKEALEIGESGKIKESLFAISELCKEYTYLLED